MDRFSPLVRLRITFNHQLRIDERGLLHGDRKDKFLKMIALAEEKRDRMLRSIIVSDILCWLCILGTSVKLPGFGIALSEVPIAVEVLAILSSLAFLYLIFAFITQQAYEAIHDQFAAIAADGTLIDPDYISYSERFFELALKVVRPKLNLFGPDILAARPSFTKISQLFIWSMIASLAIMAALHFLTIVAALRHTLTQPVGFWFKFFVFGSILTLTASAIACLVGVLREFEFHDEEIAAHFKMADLPDGPKTRTPSEESEGLKPPRQHQDEHHQQHNAKDA